jgi:hypothetical protein
LANVDYAQEKKTRQIFFLSLNKISIKKGIRKWFFLIFCTRLLNFLSDLIKSLFLPKIEKSFFWHVFDQFFCAIAHAESEKIDYFNSRPHILRIIDLFKKKTYFYPKILKLKSKTNFSWEFDLNIGFLGSFYPVPQLGLKKNE